MGVMCGFSWVLLSIFLDLNSRTSALHESCAHMYNFHEFERSFKESVGFKIYRLKREGVPRVWIRTYTMRPKEAVSHIAYHNTINFTAD